MTSSKVADEVTSSNDEILSVCIRFVDRDKNTREEFIEFIDLHRITGEAISNSILEFYGSVGLDIRERRGQCYDDCARMSSLKKCVAGLILQHAPCYKHTL